MADKFIDPAAKLSRHFDRLAAWKRGDPFPPIGVEIDLSAICNLNCEFCDFAYLRPGGQHSAIGGLIEMNLLERTLVQLAEFGIKSVTFSGGGEPLLHPRVAEAVSKANSLGLKVGLYTNGTLITKSPGLADILRRNLSWIVISLDEVDSERYSRRKGADAFEKALMGIRALRQAEGGASLCLSFLLHRENKQDIFRMISLHRSLGTDYVEFRPTVRFHPEAPSEIAEDSSWMDDVLPILERLAEEPDIEVPLHSFHSYRHFVRDYEKCEAILFTGIITPDGRVWRCVNQRDFSGACLGDLNRESLPEIWERQKPFSDFYQCRIACRGHVLNETLHRLARPLPHEEFI